MHLTDFPIWQQILIIVGVDMIPLIPFAIFLLGEWISDIKEKKRMRGYKRHI